MGSNWEKFNIAIALLEKWPFLRVPKIILHFDGSNNNFADCMYKFWIKKIWGILKYIVFIPITFNNPLKACFSNDKYRHITIQT